MLFCASAGSAAAAPAAPAADGTEYEVYRREAPLADSKTGEPGYNETLATPVGRSGVTVYLKNGSYGQTDLYWKPAPCMWPYQTGECGDVYLDGVKAGVVTSGTQTPFLKKAIGMAYLPADRAVPGTEFEVDIRGRKAKAVVVPLPFYKREKK